MAATASSAAQGAAAQPKAIADVSVLKALDYLSLDDYGLGHYRSHALFMRHPQRGYYLMVSSEAWQKPAHFDMLQRLERRELQYKVLRCESEVIQALHAQHASPDGQQAHAEDASDIERLCDDILREAGELGSSDIHIECRATHADVLYRVYGQRLLKRTLSKEAATGLGGLLYDIRADHSAKSSKGGVKWAPEQPLDAVINHVDAAGKALQIRFASAPMYPKGSFQIVMRLLRMDPKAAPPFDSLGYTPQQQAHIEEMIVGAQGLVLMVGPTNSGKSTTMQALARRIAEVRGASLKIESIEDPVEYIIPGAVQMPVSARADFADLLKSTLRHDPDVLIVGEVRDAESAENIKNIVLAGRKVLATLHAYDAMAAWSRLIHIGVPADVLYMSGFVSGIIYQRLLPKLCPDCSLPLDEHRRDLPAPLLDRIERVMLNGTGSVRLRNPRGCPACRDAVPGYVGRSVCAEYVVPDQRLLDALREGQHQAAKSLWMAGHSDTGYGPTAVGHALHLMAQGLADPRDVESQVGMIRLPHADAELAARVVTGVHEPAASAMAVALNDAGGDALEDLYDRRAA